MIVIIIHPPAYTEVSFSMLPPSCLASHRGYDKWLREQPPIYKSKRKLKMVRLACVCAAEGLLYGVWGMGYGVCGMRYGVWGMRHAVRGMRCAVWHGVCSCMPVWGDAGEGCGHAGDGHRHVGEGFKVDTASDDDVTK